MRSSVAILPFVFMAQSRALIAVCLACIAPLLFGYSLGFTSPALLFMEISAKQSIFPSSVASSAGGGVVSAGGAEFGSLVNVGAMLGAIAGGPLSDRLGRRPAIGSCALLWLVAWLWLAWATTPLAALASRALTGIAVGIASGTVPVYIAEVAPAAIRGALGALNQLGVVVGILMVYALGYAFQHEQASNVACTLGGVEVEGLGDAAAAAAATAAGSCTQIAVSGWSCRGGKCFGQLTSHVPLAYAAALTSLLLGAAVLLLLPETPAFLTQKGRTFEAARVQSWLGGGDEGGPAGEADSVVLTSVVGASANPDSSSDAGGGASDGESGGVGGGGSDSGNGGNGGNGGSAGGGGGDGGRNGGASVGGGWAALMAPNVRPPMVVACGLMLVQQLSGINAVIFYSSGACLPLPLPPATSRPRTRDPCPHVAFHILDRAPTATTPDDTLADILLRGGIADANLGGLLIMAIQVFMTGCAVLLVDRAGRRPLLLGSIVGMLLSCLALAWFFAHGNEPSWLAITSLVGYVCSFSAGLGAL